MDIRVIVWVVIFCVLFAWVLGVYLGPMFSQGEEHRLSWLGVGFVAGVGVKTTFSILAIRWLRRTGSPRRT